MYKELKSTISEDPHGFRRVNLKNLNEFGQQFNREQVKNLIYQLTEIKHDMKSCILVKVLSFRHVFVDAKLLDSIPIKTIKTNRACPTCNSKMEFIFKGANVRVDNYHCDNCNSYYIEK